MIILNLIAQAADFGTGLKPQSGIAGTNSLANFDTDTPFTSLETLISTLIGLFTTIGSITFIFMFLYGAFKWISGGDDSAKIQKARDQMVQAVLGLIIMVAGYALIGLIGTMVGISILNPAELLNDIF